MDAFRAVFAEVRMSAARPTDRPDRRRFLGWMATAPVAATAAAVGLADVACAPGGPSDDAVRVDLADLAPGERRVVRWRDKPVEIVRTEDGVRARSLLCTHFSCTVRWVEAEGEYRCPCHGGRFDGDGRPVGGPPVAPLPDVPVTLDGDVAWVGRG